MFYTIILSILSFALWKTYLPWVGVSPAFGAFLDVLIFGIFIQSFEGLSFYFNKLDGFTYQLYNEARRFLSDIKLAKHRSAPQRIFFDMDGVLYKFLNVPYEEILEKGYFENLPSQKNIQEAAKLISRNPKYSCQIASCYLTETTALKEKMHALSRDIPEIRNRIFIPYGDDKFKHIPGGVGPTDILIDDYSPNCEAWAKAGGVYVKVSKNSEDKKLEKGKHPFVISPDDSIYEIVHEIEQASMEVCKIKNLFLKREVLDSKASFI